MGEYQDFLYGLLPQNNNGGGVWSPCYQATKHGWNHNIFYQRCTIPGTLILVKKEKYLFGGYTDRIWKKRKVHGVVEDKKLFNKVL